MEHQTTYKVELSPFDQTIPRLYVHKLFCFPFPDPSLHAEAIERLEHALSATIIQWPFIAGNVGPAGHSSQCNAVQLCYTTPAIGQIGHKLLIAKTLSATEFPWTYQQLSEAGMPPSTMKKEVLSTVPEWPKPAETYPALAVQANFIDGGLILCFAFHHAVADGGSFTTFLKAFAAATKSAPSTDCTIDLTPQKRLEYAVATECDTLSLECFPEYDSKSVPVRPPPSTRITTRILTFKATTVQQLEDAIKDQLKRNPEGPTWVSNIACLSSLIWVAVVRARRARLSPSETTKIGIAVNARSVMKPQLPEEYFGNAIVHSNATANVSELIPDHATDTPENVSPITTATLTLAASRMRQAVQNVDSTYVNERLKTFSALRDPTEVSRAYTRAMDPSNTGLDFSSWRDQGANVEFSIPGVGCSRVHVWRKAWSQNEGAYNILPRRGWSKGDADWEISLGLSVEDMERVCSEGELGGWLSRVVE